MQTNEGPDFATYDLTAMPPNGVYGLAGGLLPEMARVMRYEGLGDTPTEAALRGFIRHVGPDKWLQNNIGLVQQLLGTDANAVSIAADWIEQSGCLKALDRSFVRPDLRTPTHVDVAVISGGVARWMLRRANRLIEHIAAGNRVGKIILVAGNDAMKSTEHAMVAANAAGQDKGDEQSEFMHAVIAPMVRFAVRRLGTPVHVIPVGSGEGSDVMATAAIAGELADRTAVLVGNAPAGVQTAAQLRRAVRQLKEGYDRDGTQLYVLTDDIEVDRHGKGPMMQNSLTALGLFGRNALGAHLEQLSLAG